MYSLPVMVGVCRRQNPCQQLWCTMYKDYFRLKEEPFSLTPDPKYLYLTEQHRQALEHMLYGIRQRKGFICISGEVGAGKTTLCRAVLARTAGARADWLAYQKHRGPFGPQRWDVYIAMLLTAIVRNPDSAVADFLPQWRPVSNDLTGFYDRVMAEFKGKK